MESALLKVNNDLLVAADGGHFSVLVLFDLSTAFGGPQLTTQSYLLITCVTEFESHISHPTSLLTSHHLSYHR